MSLYRQYRPQSFADVIGQDHIVTTLERAAEQDKLAHAYLFAGNRGTGKTSVARILAKTLMMRNVKDDTVRKHIDKGVEDGTIVDLLEIDAASNRGIDDIRDLVEKIQFSPVVASAKVYIIDEVHMLTKEAFNALLKTLEEPPPYAFFILATTELNKIPITIQSRCQCFPFRNIRDEDIIRRLQYIADCEKISIERDALRMIAHHVDGGMRDAISLLDQLRSLSKISKEDVLERTGSPGHEYVENVQKAIANADSQALLEAVAAIEDNGVPPDIFLRQLLEATRMQLHTAVQNNESTDALVQQLDILLRAIRDVRSSPLPIFTLETALLNLCTPRGTQSPARVTAATNTTSDKPAIPQKKPEQDTPKIEEKPKQTPKDEPEKAVQVEAAELSIDSVREQWSAIVKQVEPASIRMSLKDGRVQQIEGTTVTVGFASAFHRDKVSGTDASRAVEQIMEKIFRKSVRLKCTLADRPAELPKQDAVNLAEAAAEIF